MAKNVYSVSQVNSYIKNMFDQDYMLGSIQVRGEISNLKYHSSGHIYFSLKEGKEIIACVMFRSSAGSLDFRLEDGRRPLLALCQKSGTGGKGQPCGAV